MEPRPTRHGALGAVYQRGTPKPVRQRAEPPIHRACGGAPWHDRLVTAIALGWRIHSWWATVVAVSGPATDPVVLLRERVTLVEEASAQEPYHAAVPLPLDEAPAFIESAQEAAASVAASKIATLASTLGPVAAVGVVGGDRRLPELPRILTKHALLHAAERDLYERAVIDGARRAGLPVVTTPATGKLFEHASRALDVDLEPLLAALGKSIGKPWQKDHKEATAVALLALQI